MPTDVARSHTFSARQWNEEGDARKLLLQTGWVVLNDVPAHQRVIEALLGALGELQPQYRGIRFWDVVPLKRGEGTSIGDRGIDLHTELAEFPRPPDYVALYCLRPADEGGALHLLDAAPFIEGLPASETANLLAARMTIKCERSIAESYGEVAISAPVLSRVGDRLAVRFDPNFVDPAGPSCIRDFKDGLASYAKTRTISFVQPEGSLVIWDNFRILHGRGEFSDPARRLWRCCVLAGSGKF